MTPHLAEILAGCGMHSQGQQAAASAETSHAPACRLSVGDSRLPLMRTRFAFAKLVLLLGIGWPALCQAQWLTQQIKLTPGWNAVFLEVQPEPRSCDEVFRNHPVQSVWKWDRRFSTVQFEIAPSLLLPENPDWLMWLPSSNPRAFLNRLFELQGCQSYLVQVASNAAPFTLALKGRVLLPRLEWYPHGLNLVGFPVNPRNPPTFTEFFKFTPEVDVSLGYANELYRIDSTGRGQRIVQPARERPQPGVAYWVGCARPVKRMSAVQITPVGGAVDFGSLLSWQEVSIRNIHPSAALTIRVQERDSESAPLTGGFPELAGPVPLSFFSKNASNEWVWAEFPTNGLAQTLAPQEEWIVHLGVRRRDFAPYMSQGTNGCAYESILEITDTAESLRIRVPVLAQSAGVRSISAATAVEAHTEKEGLWVGQVTVNQVNAPAYTADLLPAPAPASFRLLVHVDGYGNARLLQQVLLAWDSGLTDPPHTNGTYALYASPAALPAAATDIKRISSAAFPLMAPVLLTNSGSDTLTGTVIVGYNDPVNPFLHRYHPLHDNKNWDYQAYTNAVETRTIQRDLTFRFDPATNNAVNPFWGVESLKGIYQETFSGLRANTKNRPLTVQGQFTLQRISRMNTLREFTP